MAHPFRLPFVTGLVALLATVCLASDLAAQALERVPLHVQRNAANVSQSGGFGQVCIGLGDVDPDGFADYAVSAPFVDLPSGTARGAVYVYSGRTAQLLRRLDGVQANAGFGMAMADIGDQDGDGTPEIVVGAPFSSVDAMANAGRLFVFRGADGSMLWTSPGTQAGGELGTGVGIFPDFTFDNGFEVVASSPGIFLNGTAHGEFTFFHGSSGTVMGSGLGLNPNGRLGEKIDSRSDFPVAVACDAFGDLYRIEPPVGGLADVLIERPNTTPDPDVDLALVHVELTQLNLVAIGRPLDDSGGFVDNGSLDLFPLGGVGGPVVSRKGKIDWEELGRKLKKLKALQEGGGGEERVGYLTWDLSHARLSVNSVSTSSSTEPPTVEADFNYSQIQVDYQCLEDVTGDGWAELLTSGNDGSSAFDASVWARGLEVTSHGLNGGGGYDAKFKIRFGPANAGRPYHQVFGTTGSFPGSLIELCIGKPILLPLNIDSTTTQARALANGPLFPKARGTLDANGEADSEMHLPPAVAAMLSNSGKDITSTVLTDYAACVIDHMVSNPVILPSP